MGHLCRACQHPKRQEIDMELLTHAASYRRMAARYGLSDKGLRHHEQTHLRISWELSKGLQAMLSAQNLLTKLGEWHQRMEQQYQNADAMGEIATTATVARVALQAIERFHAITLDTDIERKLAEIEKRLAATEGGTSNPTP